jgi:myo-inositol-1(or 4)-monophosphatase
MPAHDPAAPLNARFRAFAEALADAAGKVIRPYFRAFPDAEQKADASPVTRADREAEAVMRTMIRDAYPDHGLIGEEFGASNPGSALCWVIDPIDGTRAFITGRPSFGTLIALLHDGRPVLGVIDQPITGERWIGVAGQPTVFCGDLRGRVGARRCAKLADAELSATSPDMFGSAWTRFQQLSAAVRRRSWGGDCYAYGLLALGQIDLVVESGLQPWDWAALVPVVEGAGGRLTDWDGNPLTLDSTGEALAVGDPGLLPAAIEALKG